MQYHYLTLGRNVGGDTVDAISVSEAVDYVALCLKNLGCNSFSVFEGKGYWNGTPENIIRFEVFGISDSQAKNLAKWLAKQFNQENVMLLSVNSRPKFIRGDM
ncbi:nitrogen regulatory protein P-II [Pseudanabaena phage Pam2]|nr:nitrogen regulatory protein P-II [Pseudanabaena phage Pam2]